MAMGGFFIIFIHIVLLFTIMSTELISVGGVPNFSPLQLLPLMPLPGEVVLAKRSTSRHHHVPDDAVEVGIVLTVDDLQACLDQTVPSRQGVILIPFIYSKRLQNLKTEVAIQDASIARLRWLTQWSSTCMLA
ncbi:hypothetical protein ACQJBY_014096 [Aegilops geniculata]